MHGQTIQYGAWCSGNDCSSTAQCPNGYRIVSCSLEGSGDGAHPVEADNTCVARGRATGVDARAKAVCSAFWTVQVVASNGGAFSTAGQTPVTAECPPGTTVLSCSCNSAWADCGDSTADTNFAPSGSTCSKSVASSGGRAKVFAICAWTGSAHTLGARPSSLASSLSPCSCLSFSHHTSSTFPPPSLPPSATYPSHIMLSASLPGIRWVLPECCRARPSTV